MKEERCKKRILFLIGNLESGGVSKSMVSLLNIIDRRKYDVSLWMGMPSGIFYDLLPDDINLISNTTTCYLLQGIKGLYSLVKENRFLLCFCSIVRMLLSCFDKGYAGWFLSRLIPSISEEYDVIVDYNGQHQLYYMVDKLNGKKKITFFHNDYSKWDYYYAMDKRYYRKVDYIFTISEKCLQVLKEYFPDAQNKMHLMYNISSIQTINRMAEESNVNWEGKLSFLSIGHVCERKGTDIAIKAASILKKRGIIFKWYFLGNVMTDYSDLISSLDVKDNIVFLGMKANPYPYLKACTIYVHPSRFEGKSIALDEAKILCKPIVVTNFSTVKDQFVDRVNASICEMNPESLAITIAELLKNENLKIKYQTYLSSHMVDNSSEIEKLYAIVDEN